MGLDREARLVCGTAAAYLVNDTDGNIAAHPVDVARALSHDTAGFVVRV